jgi:hypothetical protein
VVGGVERADVGDGVGKSWCEVVRKWRDTLQVLGIRVKRRTS